RLLVLKPFAGIPLRERGCPPEALPSPPPIGWSTGFMATPLVLGLRPSQRLRPAFPDLSWLWSVLETVPIVARHAVSTILVSPEGSLMIAYLPSRAASCAKVPALRAIAAPLPGFSSML